MAVVETSDGARMPDPSAAGGEAGARTGNAERFLHIPEGWKMVAPNYFTL
jgi:hypothetical protein